MLKLDSPDHPGDADFVFEEGVLKEFESKVGELRRASNPLKQDGFQILWSKQSGDANLHTMIGRIHGIKLKIIQIDQQKPGQPKSEQQITLDQSYSDFNNALRKLKRTP